MDEYSGTNPFKFAAGSTGNSILPPSFEVGDRIVVTATMVTTSTSGANFGEWTLKRTDSGAVVHEDLVVSRPFLATAGMESGDTALVIDVVDDTNDMIFHVSRFRKE